MAPKGPKSPQVTVVLLAAGASSRMDGVDKLLEKIDGVALLARVAQACVACAATDFIAITRPGDAARNALIPTGFHIMENPDWSEGMASSLRLGVNTLKNSCDAVLVVLGDMPDVSAADMRALITAFDPAQGRSICRAMTGDGTQGHPVLFGHQHFSALGRITGDTGARAVLAANPDATALVKTHGQSALTDLDTPKDWAAYRSR